MTGAAALGAALVLPAVARAQELPSGPVKIVVGFPAGGGTDVLARLLGQKLGVLWNMPVIVENRAGAAGIIAAEQVARQPGDGNTLLMAHVNSHGIAPGLQPKLAYSVDKDFTPIALVGKTPTILIGGAGPPAKTSSRCAARSRARSCSAQQAADRPSTWRWKSSRHAPALTCCTSRTRDRRR